LLFFLQLSVQMRIFGLAAVFLCLLLRSAPAQGPDDFFEKEVRPLLVENCHKCHGNDKPKGGLRLTSRAAILKGGDSGPAAIAAKPDESLLIRAIGYRTDQLKMPPNGKLSDRQIDTLTRWVRFGLPWPEGKSMAAMAGNFQITAEQRRFWSFQPVQDPPPPSLHNLHLAPRNAIDRFIFAGLERHGLTPAQPADKRTLIRRATFDLTGLPPTPEEIDAFLNDESPDAYPQLIDRLLASPAYGERWGRHWLDLVRYTDSFDSRGLGGPGDCADAWRYRDWVVQALNSDIPYDRFVRMQIAGDILPNLATDRERLDGIVATTLLAIGNWGGGDADKEKLLTDIADDQVDVVSKTFMALTLSCARCHDHKFDPLSQNDYYGLAGIFFSTHILPNVGPKTDGPPMLRVPLETPAEKGRREQLAAGLRELEKDLTRETDSAYHVFAERMLDQTAVYVLAAWDFQHLPKGQPQVSLEAFANERKVHAFALRRWLGLWGGGDDRLMQTKIRDLAGRPGVHGWRGEADCPVLLVNTTDAEQSIATFKLPPKGVTVHPGPKNGVVVGWRSPIQGTVKVSGQFADADPQCGDGIAWAIDLKMAIGRQELASGAFANGGRQRFADGQNGKNLTVISVEAGDTLEFVVLPKGDYTCDTTVIELTISTAERGQSWNLSRDLTKDPLSANPHADSLGHADVWYFADMGDRVRGKDTGLLEFAKWRKALAEAKTAEDRKTAAREVQNSFRRIDVSSPFWLASAADETVLDAPVRERLARLRGEIESLRKAMGGPKNFANGAQEGGVPGSPHAGVHDVQVHIRGRYDRLGDLVPRRFPEILAGSQPLPKPKGSGRLELAQWLTQPDHPLTARVMVNRIWQFHFGEGLVRTPSNFGKLGEPPTHPELLDWLARQFVAGGCSIKAMHRLIMLSGTYQQSSVPPADTLQRDPDNHLFGRMNRRRLEAEPLRDSLLAVAGLLDRLPRGPAVRDFNSPRRTIYQISVRSDRSGYGPLFDVADPTAPTEKRAVSTVAPQALFLMNHPFVVDCVRALSGRSARQPGTDGERVHKLYALLFGRPPSADEQRIGLDYLGRQPNETAWLAYCQLLICANEFVYVD
jgi:hypothetical protein